MVSEPTGPSMHVCFAASQFVLPSSSPLSSPGRLSVSCTLFLYAVIVYDSVPQRACAIALGSVSLCVCRAFVCRDLLGFPANRGRLPGTPSPFPLSTASPTCHYPPHRSSCCPDSHCTGELASRIRSKHTKTHTRHTQRGKEQDLAPQAPLSRSAPCVVTASARPHTALR